MRPWIQYLVFLKKKIPNTISLYNLAPIKSTVFIQVKIAVLYQ